MPERLGSVPDYEKQSIIDRLQATGNRQQKLKESEDFQEFLNKVEEEEAWMNEKQQVRRWRRFR